MSCDLGKLTDGELTFIYRRRNFRSQKAAAWKHNIPLSRWKKMEYDQYPVKKHWVKVFREMLREKRLQPHEKCVLMRRRTKGKVTQDDIAKEIKRCRNWVVLMEKGKAPVQELLDYWEC